MSPNPTVLSLYSGAGGLDYGFKLAGFDTIFANDIDPLAVETHHRLMGDQTAVAGDIDTLRLPDDKVDVVIGGPPCQGFSVAGKMDPRDPRSRHVWKFLEVVSTIRPACFVMENVKALAENERWAALRDGLMAASSAIGYSTRMFVLKASDHGVAQKRERMFLIGSQCADPFRPRSTSAENPPSTRSVLGALPPIGSPGNDRLATAAITLAARPVLRRSPYAGMLFNGAGRPINLDGPAPTLPASMGGNKTPIVDQFWLEDPSHHSWVEEYHSTLWRGGRPLPWGSAPDHLRRLSANEAAALQSFPLDLEWAGPTSAVFRQVGNAVPPLLAHAVARVVLDLLASGSSRGRSGAEADPQTAEELRSIGIGGQLTLV